MRTQTLLVAAATLAVSAATSMAQVYSQNIVGYVNVPLPANQYTLACNPLSDGTNTINSVIPNAPVGLTVLAWNGSGYDTLIAQSGAIKWYDPIADDDGGATPLPPGRGFFIKNGPVATNITFVGTVVYGTNLLAINPGYNLVSSIGPVSTNLDGLGLTLSALPVNSSVLTWDGGALSYTTYIKQANNTWYDPIADELAQPQINVGRGFFVKNNGSSFNWTNVLNVP